MKKRCFAALVTLLVFLCTSALAGVEITEVSSKNVTLRLDENGLAHDFVVIANTGADTVDLAGYSLSDGGPDAYTFEDVTLKPGESLTVYCTGKEPNAPFKLAAEGETVYLYDAAGGFVQSLVVPAMGDNQVYKDGSVVDGEETRSFGGVVINELLAVNTLLTVGEKTPDFIELYNAGGVEVDLAGWGLSDNSSKPAKYVFPETVIPAKDYLAVYLTGDVGFGLSGDGECVLLTDPDGKAVDFVAFGAQAQDVALALMDGAMQETTTPTPGTANVITK